MSYALRFAVTVVVAVAAGTPSVEAAQSVYRYRDNDGNVHYSDRPPPDGRAAEVQSLQRANLEPVVRVSERLGDRATLLVATNEYHCPVEFEIELYDETGRSLGAADRVVLAPAADTVVATIAWAGPAADDQWRYEYRYMLGDPHARHADGIVYRAPFSVGQAFDVSQAWPDDFTHRGGSAHAVDFAMPEGTAVHAARAGTVVEIAYKSYRGGTSAADAERANLVRILHDDGTFAVYAHLALNSVRVRPGDTVEAGQFIAASGNTGFSSGPHLHFAVERNTGFALASQPVVFAGPQARPQRARTGVALRAH